jgi:anti-sigma factor RsiW
MTPDETQIRALLPWYVNGTLNESHYGKLESHLVQWPHLRAEVAWLTQLREQVREPLYDRTVQPSASAGLDTLMSRIHAEQSGKVVPLRSMQPARAATPRWFPAAIGLAASIILVQAVVLGSLIGQPGRDALTPLSGGAAAAGTLLQMTFKPTATEARMRQALAAVQGEIVSGPGALGVYTVRVPEGQGPAVLQKLQSDRATVESVVLLPGR